MPGPLVLTDKLSNPTTTSSRVTSTTRKDRNLWPSLKEHDLGAMRSPEWKKLKVNMRA